MKNIVSMVQMQSNILVS